MRALCLRFFYPSKSPLIYSIFSSSSSTLKLPAAKAAGIALAMHWRGSILDPFTGSHPIFRRVLHWPHLGQRSLHFVMSRPESDLFPAFCPLSPRLLALSSPRHSKAL